MRYVAFSASRVLVSAHSDPQPRTILADLTTGKVSAVLQGTRATLEPEYDEVDVEWVDVEDRFIVTPGLVE
jgi:hypothetical protein